MDENAQKDPAQGDEDQYKQQKNACRVHLRHGIQDRIYCLRFYNAEKQEQDHCQCFQYDKSGKTFFQIFQGKIVLSDAFRRST